jgi:hypothetical protein
MSTRTPFQWGNANFSWESNPFPNQSIPIFKWNDCALILEVIEALGGGYTPDEFFGKHHDKKKKFIKLLCKIEGKEYKETKEVLDRKIRISDVSLVAKEVLGINIKVEM